MLEKETYMNRYVKDFIELKLNTIPENAGSGKKCWFCEKQFEEEVDVTEASNPVRCKDFAKTVVKNPCHLTGNFCGIADSKFNLDTRKAQSSFSPKMFHNFSGCECRLIFENIVIMAAEKGVQLKKLII